MSLFREPNLVLTRSSLLLARAAWGEVYRGRDTRNLAGNPQAKDRFEREAKSISAMQHANICTLYDVGSQDGVSCLVMEYLEGETLADRRRKGPLPLEQDGSFVVFAAHPAKERNALWVRSLNGAAEELAGTDGAYSPFWSPDGRFIGFFAKGKLKKIPAAGGPVTTIADAPNARDGAWGEGNVIGLCSALSWPVVEGQCCGG